MPPKNARSFFNQGPLSRRKDRVQKNTQTLFAARLFLTGTAFTKKRQGPRSFFKSGTAFSYERQGPRQGPEKYSESFLCKILFLTGTAFTKERQGQKNVLRYHP